jgi:hypothetical protein
MTISSIQKKKFLDTIYKNYFSSGIEITEEKVKEIFSKYFSNYLAGFPINLNPELFRSTAFSNVDVINQKNAQVLLNIETLYDAIFESSEELFDVTNALNNRIDQLRKRRSDLEAKVDDLIFANQNSDGVFAAITESFSTGKNMDYNFSTAFLDTNAKKVTLPKLNSAVFDLTSSNSIVSPNPTYTLSFNRANIETGKTLDDSSFFASVFDGLSNTEWSKSFNFQSVGVVSLTLNIPITTNVQLSKIEGRLNSVSPTDIYVKVNYINDEYKSEVKSKKSSLDYDNFSFDFTPGLISSIDLILVKVDPDYINQSRNDKYEYRFGIRDINISGQYYDRYATYVSNSYGLNTNDNKNLVIDSVSIEVEEGNPSTGLISYYIAPETGNETDLNDYNWTPVSKPFDVSASFSSSINLNGSTVNTKKIVDTVTDSNKQILKIAKKQRSSLANINEENPTSSIYSGNSIYRIATLPASEEANNPYILEGVNSISGKYVSYVSPIFNEPNSLKSWTDLINGVDQSRQVYDLPSYTLSNDSVFFNGPNMSQISIFLPFNLYCANDIIVKHRLVKNDQVSQLWDVCVYINDTKYAIPSGTSSESIEWRFQKGLNKIKIAIDCSSSTANAKAPSAKGSLTLMESHSILEYGIVYDQYYSYVDPMELKYSRSEFDNIFTIDTVFGNKEILSKKDIKSNSRIFYFSNNPNAVKKIRFRADFHRGNNPLSSPSLNSYRIKFKNSQSFSELSQSLIKNNTNTSDI